MRTLIKKGTVYLEDGIDITDVLVEDGLIAEIGKIGYRIDDCRAIDATGLHVLPGLIDIHTHLDDTIGKYELADTWPSGSEIAAQNGITTLCGFITQRLGRPLQESVEKSLARAEGKAYCDYAFHLTPTSFDRKDWEAIEQLLSDGFKTFKFYTTYREAGLFINYSSLSEIFHRIKEIGARALVHCEDDGMLSLAKEKVSDKSNPYSHALSRPMEAEIEAIKQVLGIVEKTRCQTHLVHVSTSDGARLAAQARQDIPVSMETCPQYLFLSDEKLKQPDGHRYICSPPLRPERNRQDMKALALGGTFDAYATDHCAFGKKDKDENKSDYTSIPSGLAGIGVLAPLIYEMHRDLSSCARHLALNPAKIAGLYPRKGTIRKGSDADLAIFNIDGKERNIRSTISDSYETYPGRTTALNARHVLLRGDSIVEDGSLIDRNRYGGRRV